MKIAEATRRDKYVEIGGEDIDSTQQNTDGLEQDSNNSIC